MIKNVKHLNCPNCHMKFEQIGSKITPKLMFGLCPLCGEQIQENQLLDEADEIVNAVYVTDNEPILAA